MKVSKAQAAENRERILVQAGRLFRRKGFDGVGVSELMAAAGLTNGAFYGHFASKDDLIAEACERLSDAEAAPWVRLAQTEGGEGLPRLLDDYLSLAHVEHRGSGCLYAALAGDVARQPAPARGAFTKNLQARVERLARALSGRSREAKRRKALATLSSMVGALALARAVDDPAFAEEILEATKVSLA